MPADAIVTELLKAIQQEINESVGENLSSKEQRALKIGPLVAEMSLSQILSADKEEPGVMSAVLASKSDPEAVIVIKGNKPLTLRYSAQFNVLFYASEACFLDVVLAGMEGWDDVSIKPISMVKFNCNTLPNFERLPLRFSATQTAGGFQKFTSRKDGSDIYE